MFYFPELLHSFLILATYALILCHLGCNKEFILVLSCCFTPRILFLQKLHCGYHWLRFDYTLPQIYTTFLDNLAKHFVSSTTVP